LVQGRDITDDILMGGTGRNYLNGGGGNDQYILSRY
jgi:Ca2+-binding RTX toxin-like protein